MAFSILEISYANHEPSAESGLLARSPELVWGPDICLILFFFFCQPVTRSVSSKREPVANALRGETGLRVRLRELAVGIPRPNLLPAKHGHARRDSAPGCHPCARAGLRQRRGTGRFPRHKPCTTHATVPSQVFKPVWSSGEHWFCSALGGPGWAASPQKGASKSCGSCPLPDGC